MGWARITIPRCGTCCDLCVPISDTLAILFSGVTQNPATAGCQPDGAGNSFTINSFSITGPYTLTRAVGFNVWNGTGGAYDIDGFAGTEACDVVATNYTGTFNILVLCTDGLFAWLVSPDNGPPGLSFVVFTSADGIALDTATPNVPSVGPINMSVNGTATLTEV